MPTYHNAPTPTSPAYTSGKSGANAVFDDQNVLFDDLLCLFNGGIAIYSMPAAPTSPTYTQAAPPS